MKTTLLIMAAGIGSRFGTGIKQLATVDSSKHIIMDYSIHDAIEAGFNKIIFIIRRDICKVEDGHTHVTDVVETKNIVKVNGGAEADGKSLDPESFVSMNFWGFPGNPPEFLKVLEEGFVEFFESEVPTNPMKAEYLLPTIIGGMLREGLCTVRALPTNDTWYGMTYQEDVAAVQEAFAELLKKGKYREDLFSDL